MKKLLLRNLIQLNASRKSMTSTRKLAQLFRRTKRSRKLPRACREPSASWFLKIIMIHQPENQP